MQVTVFGANGSVGRKVVASALEREHTVVAFCHSSPKFTQQPGLTIVQGDITDTAVVTQAIQGSDCLISALGSWHTKSKDILSSGMRIVIPSMEKIGVKRIISLTGSEARDVGDKLSLIHSFMHRFLLLVAGKILRDSEEHITLLRATNLDWTVLRSPIMTSKPNNKYTLKTRRPQPWDTISRDAVVAALLDELEASTNLRTSPYIHKN